MTTAHVRDAALAYAAEGFRVHVVDANELPWHLGQKLGGNGGRCVCEICRGIMAPATTDPGQLEADVLQWANPGLAVQTGVVGGLLVLDVDSKPNRFGGPVRGEEGLAELLRRWPQLAETRTARTPSGGFHLWLAHPGQRIDSWAAPDLALSLLAENGMAVSAPTVRPGGGAYVWATEPDRPLVQSPSGLPEAVVEINAALGGPFADPDAPVSFDRARTGPMVLGVVGGGG